MIASVQHESGRHEIKSLCWEVLQIAGPNALGYISTLVNELTNVLMLGRMGNDAALAAAGLGNMMQNCIGLSVAFGLAGALDTLVSQAYGAGQNNLSVLYYQRCRLLLAAQLVWMIPVLSYSEEILVFIHQDTEVARDAGRYNSASVYGLLAVFQFEVGRKFFQNQTYTAGPAAISWFCSALHVLWCYIFVVHKDLGNYGAGLANVTTWYLSWGLLLCYSAYRAPEMGFRRRDVLGFSRAALRGWGKLLVIGIPSTVQLCCEWWFWEMCAIVVGYLGAEALAAHVATNNLISLLFMPTVGFSEATATIAGNAIGAEQPQKAQRVIGVCAAMNTILWTILAACVVCFRHFIAEMYTKEEGVQRVMQSLLCIFAFAGYFDSNQNILGGGLRGIGHQNIASAGYIVGFYGFMLPLGVLLAFPLKIGVQGIWYSFVAGTGSACAFFLWYVRRLDFADVVAEAKVRMAAEEGGEGDLSSSMLTPSA